MATVNTLKGYGKVALVEDPKTPPKKSNHRKLLIILIPTIILSIVIICLATTLILHNHNHNHNHKKNPETTKSNPTNNSNSITAVCSQATHPTSCISSLQNSTTTDPEALFHLSLQVCLHELTNLSSLPQQLVVKVNDPGVKSALLDCQNLFTDAVDNVNSSVSSMEVRPGENMLSVQKINDIKTWLSSAMTNLETCLDGLDEMGSSLHEVVQEGMRKSNEYTSNSLAIAAKIDTILDKLHVTMH